MKKIIIFTIIILNIGGCVTDKFLDDQEEEQKKISEQQAKKNREPKIEIVKKKGVVTYIHEDEFKDAYGYDMRMMIATKMNIKFKNENEKLSRLFFKVEKVKASNGEFYNNMQTMDRYDANSIEVFLQPTKDFEREMNLNFVLTKFDTRDLISESTSEQFKTKDMFKGDSLENGEREYITEPEQYIYTSSLRGVRGHEAVKILGGFLENIETVYVKAYYKTLKKINGQTVESFEFIEKQIELDFSEETTFQLNYTSYPMFTRIDSTFFIKELRYGQRYEF